MLSSGTCYILLLECCSLLFGVSSSLLSHPCHGTSLYSVGCLFWIHPCNHFIVACNSHFIHPADKFHAVIRRENVGMLSKSSNWYSIS